MIVPPKVIGAEPAETVWPATATGLGVVLALGCVALYSSIDVSRFGGRRGRMNIAFVSVVALVRADADCTRERGDQVAPADFCRGRLSGLCGARQCMDIVAGLSGRSGESRGELNRIYAKWRLPCFASREAFRNHCRPLNGVDQCLIRITVARRRNSRSQREGIMGALRACACSDTPNGLRYVVCIVSHDI